MLYFPGSSRFLNVNQKLGSLSGSLSRRPSVLSESSARTPKDSHLNEKMTNMKKGRLLVGMLGTLVILLSFLRLLLFLFRR